MDEEFSPESVIQGNIAALPVIPDDTLRETTYGPGSPNPTPADLRETTGHADSPLQIGDVALQPETADQYGLKTGDKFSYKGQVYRYADTPNHRVGNVIDVFYPAGGKSGETPEFNPQAIVVPDETPKQEVSVETLPNTEFNPQALMEPAPEETAPPEQARKEKGASIEIPSFAPTAVPQVRVDIPQLSTHEIVGSPMQPVVIQPGAIPAQLPTPAGTPAPVMAPLLNAQQVLPVVQQGIRVNPILAMNMAALRKLSPNVASGIEQAAAEQISSLTAPGTLLQAPAMALPMVPEAYAAYQLYKTPEAWSNVKDAIDRYGLGSRESAAAMTNEVVRMGTAVVAPIAGKFMRGDTNPTTTLYHSSPRAFDKFNAELATETGLGGKGHFFADTPQHAAVYGKHTIAIKVPTNKIYNLADNPLGLKWEDNVDKILQEKGYEGLSNPDTGEHVIYNPNKFIAGGSGPPNGGVLQGGYELPNEGEPTGSSLLQAKSRHEIADRISAGYDSTNTLANQAASESANNLRKDVLMQYPNERMDSMFKEGTLVSKDLEALTFIEESGRNPVALKKDAELIHSSKSEKLREKYGPIIDYAVKNFGRLSNLKQRYAKLMADQMVEDTAAGINYSQVQQYVTHVLRSEPENTLVTFLTGGKSGGGGFTRYFTKRREFDNLAQAIHAGIDPASVNLAELAEHRISASKRLILEKALFQEMRATAGPDGRPAVASATNPPRGYNIVDAGGTLIASHPDYTGIWKALYGDSALRRTPTGRGLMKVVGIQKSYTLALDTYHGMRGLMKGAAYGGRGGRLGFKKGLSVFEYSDELLGEAVKRNDLTREQASWVKEARPIVMAALRNGLNVSRYADNLVGQLHATFPGTKGVNDWIFRKVFRGAMIQATYANMLRNMERFPELGLEGNARRTAREMNEVFGNLMNQGIIKDKTVRDAANMIVLAPQWQESQMKAEFRGYGQLARAPYDLVVNGKVRVGTVAQGQATAVLGYFLANQVINFATTGHSTLQNPEGHRLEAYVPVGRGIYLNPLALSAEFVDRIHQIAKRQGDKATWASVTSDFARSKLSPIGRALTDVGTQTDYRGRHLKTGTQVAVTAGSDLLPVPIMASTVMQRDATSPTGFKFGATSDQIVKQLLQGLGLRATVDYAPPGSSPINSKPIQIRVPNIKAPRIVKPNIR
jgi:hypothetical protein